MKILVQLVRNTATFFLDLRTPNPELFLRALKFHGVDQKLTTFRLFSDVYD